MHKIFDSVFLFLIVVLFKYQVGDVTILVNNAAVVHGKSLMDSDDDALLKSQHINTMGQFWVRLAEIKAEAVCMQKYGEFLLADYPYQFPILIIAWQYLQ